MGPYDYRWLVLSPTVALIAVGHMLKTDAYSKEFSDRWPEMARILRDRICPSRLICIIACVFEGPHTRAFASPPPKRIPS
jgi:hypothetical protein